MSDHECLFLSSLTIVTTTKIPLSSASWAAVPQIGLYNQCGGRYLRVLHVHIWWSYQWNISPWITNPTFAPDWGNSCTSNSNWDLKTSLISHFHHYVFREVSRDIITGWSRVIIMPPWLNATDTLITYFLNSPVSSAQFTAEFSGLIQTQSIFLRIWNAQFG